MLNFVHQRQNEDKKDELRNTYLVLAFFLFAVVQFS